VHCEVILLAFTIPTLAPATVSHRSTHFVVEAPTADAAGQVARAAERNLRDLSLQWLGRELPEWPDPCPVIVTVGPRVSRGSTTFVFKDGRVVRQEMHLEGTLARILDGVLPHEITHVVLTQHFRRPFPRWADEGGATLAEGDAETSRYREQMNLLLANPERCIALRDLFGLAHYPRDSFAFYETGFSVSSYLVGIRGRRTFLEFIGVGMDVDWDTAVRRYYGFNSVEGLERAWLRRLRDDQTLARGGPVAREALPLPAARPGAARDVETAGGISR
jgi:hypothetical protein